MASAGHWSYMPINIRGACTKASKLLSLREVASVALAGGETRALKGLKDKGSKGEEERDRGARDAGSERRAAEGPVDGAGGPPTGLNRTGKSCRLRWVNYLHPGLKRGRMTPQEERLVLELHARWGNRWSRIARRLPGRTDNEIKNYWRTHMRKKAQERKRNSSLSSSSSSSSFTSSSNSEPPIEQKVENPQFNITGVNTLTSVLEVNDEVVKGYPMDQIWREIDTSESISGLSFEEYKDEACNNYCPPILSPMWDYSCDSLWKMDEEEFKMFPQLSELLVSNYQQSIRN